MMPLKLDNIATPKRPTIRAKRVTHLLSSIDLLQNDLKMIKKEPVKSSSIDTLRILTQISSPKTGITFNRTKTYLKGKNRIELIKNKEELEKHKQKEKNALQIIYGDNPQHKRYMTQEIFTDKETYRLVQNNKRKYGPDRTKSKLNIQFFETPKANYQYRRGKEKVVAKEEVAKGLNSIYFNHMYRNSPRIIKKNLLKNIEESKIKSCSLVSLAEFSNSSSPVGKFEFISKNTIGNEEIDKCIQSVIKNNSKESDQMKTKLGLELSKSPKVNLKAFN
ncbi:unnamed protein product [Blepharisma stoltei]|uniref:Uncharacterized protein n=1 Tax=Blepharisma stoltei TaxID=1481888 RepID=A0AAU9JAR3_9CILI|nr:unnamed protein product [Blepharisma stoltei]